MDNRCQIFLQVIESRSFTKAAEALGYSQPAVSQAVHSLEEETGTVLLTRDRSGIRLTKDGEAFLPYFQAVGTAEKALEEKKKEMAGLTRAVIRIGTFTSVSRNLLVPLIHNFEEIYPEARFELRQGEYDSIAADIRSGRVDFGFVNPEFVTGIETEPVYSDTMMAVLPKSSPLGKQAAVSLMQLEHLPYILLDEGEHSVALKAFENYHLHPDIRYKVTDDYSILTMVQKEMGYSILFRLTLAGYAKDVAVVPITEPFERTIALAWRNYDALSYAAKTFLSFIRKHAPEVLRQLER